MLRNDYADQACSVARSLEIVGERWTLLIIRDALLGLRRFDDFQSSTGIARNVLTNRLERLVDNGILEKRPYMERPVRYEYVPTAKGRDLWPVVHSLMTWGDEYLPMPEGPPTLAAHRGCGGGVGAGGVCDLCGTTIVSSSEIRALPGPGARPGHPLLRAAARRAAESE